MPLLETLGLKPAANLTLGKLEMPALKPTGTASPGGAVSGPGAVKDAVAGVGDKLKTGGLAITTAEAASFASAKAEVTVLLAQLNAHPQKSHVQPDITAATTKIGQADAKYAAGDGAAAVVLAEQARTICRAAKALADKIDAYVKKRNVVVEQILALKRILEPPQLKIFLDALKATDAKLPDFVAATADIDAIAKLVADQFKPLVDDVKARMTRVQALDARARAFAAADLAEAKKQLDEGAAAFTAKEWGRGLMATTRAQAILAPAERMVTRRAAYEVQKAKTVQAITALKAIVAVKDRAVEFDAAIVQGDKLASREMMQFEQATALLEGTRTSCLTWIGASVTIDSYGKQRPSVETELAALKASPAAAKLAPAVAAGAKGLAEATRLAALAGAGKDALANWNAALIALSRARADIAQAKATADALAPAMAAKKAAGDPKNLADLRTNLKALRDQATAAQGAPFADAVKAELGRFKLNADKAGAALDKSDGKTGAPALAAAAEALMAAKTIQADHARFAPALAALEARQKKLAAVATAAKIKARLAALEKALADARAHDKAHEAVAAMASLRLAEAALAAAEKADKDRSLYDGEATTSNGRIAVLADPKLKAALTKAAAAAQAQADAFDFPAAMKTLKGVELQLDEVDVKSMAAGKPPDPNLAKTAAKMLANGGAKKLDALLQNLPAGTDVKAATAIAKGRYGVEFIADGGAPPAEELKSLQAICKMLSKVPEDVVGSESMKGGLKHVDASGKDSTKGAYVATTASVSLTGRPKQDSQKLGAALTIKVNGVEVPQLPATIPPECRPVNPKVEPDFLDWATMHEAGHVVDDSHTFMAQNGHKPEMGGWKSYGSNIQPIADAVSLHFGLAAAEEKKYVLDTLMSKMAVDPPGVANWPARSLGFRNWYTLATADGIYRVQSAVKDLTIGPDKIVFQEAYPQNWVSYLAEARNHGLTGYQFRAPGEWFAELYAGWKMGKLNDKHPAVGWLKKVSKSK